MTTDSGIPEKLDAMLSEQVASMAQNGWTASIGILGRHGPDYALREVNEPTYLSEMREDAQKHMRLRTSLCSGDETAALAAIKSHFMSASRVHRAQLNSDDLLKLGWQEQRDANPARCVP